MIDLNPTDSNALHTVVGAGQIGRRLARLLGASGHRVNLVRRGPPGAAMPGVTWLQGDITDPVFAARACAGAQVVYNCANPPDYHKWDGVLQPLFDAVLRAAADAGARLVMLDNLYMYGRTGGAPMREDTVPQPCSDKGRMRQEVADRVLAAHAAGEVQVAIGRAADFFGPQTSQAVFGDRLLEALEKGRAVEAFGDVDLPRAYSYVTDVVRGLAVLGTQPDTTGQIWHLPVAATGTTRAFLEAHAAAFGVPLTLRLVPRWAVRGLGLFVPTLSAMVEMLYQWEEPFVVDDTKFRTTFGIEPTPLEVAIEETVAAWKRRGEQAA